MKRSTVSIVVSVLALALCLAACGSSKSTKSTSSSGSVGSSTAACVSSAQQVVNQAEATPTLSIPPIAGGVASAKGKNVWFITDNTFTLLADQAQGFVDAMKKAGVKTTIFDDQSSVSMENQGIEEAVGAHADLIVTDAIETALVSTSLSQAAAAKIPVVSIYEPALSATTKAAVKAVVYLNGNITGKEMAAYAMVKTHCDLHLGFIYSSVYTLHKVVLAEFKTYLAQQCPKTCSLVTQQYNPETASTSVAPQAVSFVSSHPSMNALVLATDNLADTAVPALKASQKDILVISEGGSPEDLAFVKSDDLLQADVANSSNDFVGWTAADTALRLLTGHAAAANDTFFTRLLTTQNIPSNPADYFPFKNYPALFEKAWGLS